jgi:hypothetical protein
MEALNGFRTKYGKWPAQLEVEAGTLIDLATHSLTPLGFFIPQSKVELVLGPDGSLVARGSDSEAFDYGEEGWRTEGRHGHDARAWLGIQDDED